MALPTFLGEKKGVCKRCRKAILGGGNSYIFYFHLSGEMMQFEQYFSDGLVQPPSKISIEMRFLRGHFRCLSDALIFDGLTSKDGDLAQKRRHVEVTKTGLPAEFSLL